VIFEHNFKIMITKNLVLKTPDFGGEVLLMQSWFRGSDPTTMALSSSLIWVKLLNLPLCFWVENMFENTDKTRVNIVSVAQRRRSFFNKIIQTFHANIMTIGRHLLGIYRL
jgi:hypothetical protein